LKGLGRSFLWPLSENVPFWCCNLFPWFEIWYSGVLGGGGCCCLEPDDITGQAWLEFLEQPVIFFKLWKKWVPMLLWSHR
jgi:hypothetical protein